MTMHFSDRVTRLEPEGAYHVMQKAQALASRGADIVHLEIGQPDFPTYANIAEAGIQAIRDGHTRYTPASGMPGLRAAIAADAGARRGIAIDPAQVVVGPGAKPALFFPTLALVQPGDDVLYPDPGFPTYRAMIEVAGGNPVPVPLLEARDFSFDLDAFDRLVSARTRMVVINSPANPTGGVMPRPALEHIARRAIEFDFHVLSDEIYSRMAYEGDVPSIAALPGMAERTVICDGFSKTYAMTGWRLGYGIMPRPLAERVDLLMTHAVGCTAGFVQVAGQAALEGDQGEVDRVMAEYRRRRDLLVGGLNDIPGISCRLPQGAFYAFPNVSALGRPVDWLAERLLTEAGVALLPGTAFGDYGEGYLRLCFANSTDNLERALQRIAAALGELD